MMTVEYKGYVAGFEYDDEAELYCGSVINTEPYSVVIFELPEGYDVYQEFQISIDIYLESCIEDGVEPLPPLPLADLTESESNTPQPAASGGDGN